MVHNVGRLCTLAYTRFCPQKRGAIKGTKIEEPKASQKELQELVQKRGQKMIISYGIMFETEKERFTIGPLHSDHQLDELDVACDLVCSGDSDMLKLQPRDIHNMVIILSSNGQLEIHDLNPELIWALIPAVKFIDNQHTKGGDKN